MNTLALQLKLLNEAKTMSKGYSGLFSGTKGSKYSYSYSGSRSHIQSVAMNLPNDPAILLSKGWADITHPEDKAAGHLELKEEKTGLVIRFDKGKPGANRYEGKNHYHIKNPNATGKKNLYLDEDGNPIRKGAPKSHIMPKGGK